MPRFDRTGPLGAGPRTGWGLGFCGAGMTWRRGRGFGRFWGYNSYQPRITKKEEKEMLKEEAETLEGELKDIKERLSQLKD